VLSGECRLLVDGEERLLRPWDFFHCPAGTEHVFVGAGDGPCVVLMAGVRSADEELLYPVSELAERYGASAEEETPDPKQAYAPFERAQRGRPSYWDRLSWTWTELDLSRRYTEAVSRLLARSSASLIVSLRPTSVAWATSSAESAALAWSTNSRPGVSSE
jgi:hypothetical protein